MKRFSILCILVVLCISLLVMPGCSKAPVYQLSNLSVSPDKVVAGNTATISVDVNNIGKGQGIYASTCKIDDVPVGNQKVTIIPGTSQKLTFSSVMQQPGVHTASVDNVTMQFTVLKPAELKLSDLKLSSAQVVSGDSANVSVDVSNIGEVKGDFTVSLKVRGSEVDNRKISLDGGAGQTLNFTVATKEPGSYVVNIGDLNQNLTALKPAEFKVSTPIVSPAQVIAGWSTTVMIDVTNIGEAKGDYKAILTIGGQDLETKTVSLNSGATDTVSFTVTQDAGGSYNFSVGGQSGVLTVKEGVLPKLRIGDQWVYRVNEYGTMYTRTEVVTGEETVDGIDCYVVKFTYDPLKGGWIREVTYWVKKASLDVLIWQFSAQPSSGGMLNQTYAYTYIIDGAQWPLLVGGSYTETESVKTITVQGGYSYLGETKYSPVACKYEKIETIKTNAGEFMAFKKVYYDSTGKALANEWYSDKTKSMVKYQSLTESETIELLSYSVKDGGL